MGFEEIGAVFGQERCGSCRILHDPITTSLWTINLHSTAARRLQDSSKTVVGFLTQEQYKNKSRSFICGGLYCVHVGPLFAAKPVSEPKTAPTSIKAVGCRKCNCGQCHFSFCTLNGGVLFDLSCCRLAAELCKCKLSRGS